MQINLRTLRMPKNPVPASPTRKRRADAERNRELILDAAKASFTEHGANATLDDIGRQAGVGPGTLYRHFPTREALIEAVYRNEVDKLTAAAQRFADTLQPLDALRSWMLLLIDHVAKKALILPAMETVEGGSMRLIEGTKSQVHGAFLALVQHAIDTGDLRPEMDPNDIFRALIGVFHTTAFPGWEASARRLVDILIAGSRP